MKDSDSMKTTRTLENTLHTVSDLEGLQGYLTDLPKKNLSFSELFFSLDKVKAIAPAKLQKDADIERSLYYHIKSGAKTPGRDKILRLCLAAGLDLTETRRCLEAGKAPLLYAKNRRDAVISYAIQQGKDVLSTNLLLTSYSLPPLE
jgi:hypothetical protein